jgi:hypothetical protein
MQTMDSALADLVRGGVITRQLAESRSSTPEELKRLLENGVPASAPDMTLNSPRVAIGGPPNPNRRGI